MNLGFRLPGPARVSRSSSGRYTVGATVGPVSLSTGVSRPARRGERPFYPARLDDAVADLVVAGWVPTYADDQTAFVARGWRAARIDAVPGGVTWEPITSRRALIVKTVLWVGLALGVFAVCGGALN